MRQLATAVVLFAAVVAQPVQAKELGTIGHLFPIAEPDLLTFIGQRLQGMEDSGEMDRLQREAEARVKAHAVRPAPVAGLTPAKTDRAFLYDPTFTVRETIRDMRGNVIARAGDKVNPLDKVAFSETLYFVDGDNPQQMAWLKPQLAGLQNFKVILVKGNVHDSSLALDEPVYFDQYGTLTTKFGFEHTPVRITRADRMLRVEEVALK
ncbi:type-F conjugative transfer system protein TraW [Pantoea agglomerans]|jgi:conjugal transfer pilus assembly protein TraW|uniref:type-F conjugative transfer system protein TraW n=1 Tax=Pantoea TaxID=53335 RepID=UPI0004D8E445|nr:type-F conjugative transfer system protein TraW [Pantoea agglomerans]KEY40119.1 conjugal transfer pilus assembly protein [Pantoea agglomerans]KYN62844.1 conjugal transfer protein TraW [Pantoea agglomerans]UJL39208.1 type-F conjugative transfer system protein TraW [Pantoea agglomerans]